MRPSFKILFPLLLMTAGYPCEGKSSKAIGDFDPYIFSVPDSMATASQIEVKRAVEDIVYSSVSVKGDRYVFLFCRKDFQERGLSGKYCQWLKRNMREDSRNYRKLIRQNPDLGTAASLEEMFESAKKEHLENQEKPSAPDTGMTDIFRYGSPVECPEDNIKNLFRNWSGLVTGDGHIRLLSYDYKGTAADRRHLRKYVKHNHSTRMPSWNCSIGDDGIVIQGAGQRNASARRFAAGALLAHFVNTGDHVFSVRFSCDGREHTYYIFVKPGTCRAVTMFNAFGFSFPEMYQSDKML